MVETSASETHREDYQIALFSRCFFSLMLDAGYVSGPALFPLPTNPFLHHNPRIMVLPLHNEKACQNVKQLLTKCFGPQD